MKPLTPINMILPTPEDFLTSREVTAQFRFSSALLSSWRCKEEGPRFFRLGAKKVLYRRADVEAWLQAHAVDTNKPAC